MLDGIVAESTTMNTTTKIILAAVLATASIGYFQLAGATVGADPASDPKAPGRMKIVVAPVAAEHPPVGSFDLPHQ
jgi:hypothetical protein